MKNQFEHFLEKPHLVFTESRDSLVLLKVGGSCMKNANDIRKVANLVKNLSPKFLVVSAMKGVTTTLDKVVDLFVSEKPEAAWDLFHKKFVRFHIAIAEELQIEVKDFLLDFKKEIEEETDLASLSEVNVNGRFRNFVVSLGERVSRHILQNYLSKMKINFHHVDARRVIFTRDDGHIRLQTTMEKISNAFHANYGKSIIMEGFIAAENQNLGRNGSDTTLALIALTCFKNGFFPASIYLKADEFESENYPVHDKSMVYQTFLDYQETFPQPYVHSDAVELFKSENIPFKVINLEGTYRMIVSKEKFQYQPVKRTQEERELKVVEH